MERPKIKHTEGYSDEIFVNKPNEELRCPICLGISREITETVPCGHLFCEGCIGMWKKNHKTCPKCLDEMKETHLNSYFRNQINRLQVYCPQKSLGCDKQFRLSERIADNFSKIHSCQYENIKCEHCHNLVMRNEIQTHELKICSQRLQPCGMCDEKGRGAWISTHSCSMARISCLHNCGQQFFRKDEKAHQQVCPEALVKCRFGGISCSSPSVKRKDLKSHENSLSYHLFPLVERFQVIQQELIKSKEELSELKEIKLRLEGLTTGSRFGVTCSSLNLSLHQRKKEVVHIPPNHSWSVEIWKEDKNEINIYLFIHQSSKIIFPVTVKGWIYLMNSKTKKNKLPYLPNNRSLGPFEYTYEGHNSESMIGQRFSQEYLQRYYGMDINNCTFRLEWEILK
jgi:hypothetical protein